jgi:hypothetical protein
MTIRGRLVVACAVLIVAPLTASAQERTPRWGFNATLGTGSLSGDLSDALETPLSGDFMGFRASKGGAWRLGLGFEFNSLKMPAPYEDEKYWGLQRTYLSVTRMLKTEGNFRPYLQMRGGLARLHPRSELFAFEPPPENPGDSPTHPSNGFALGLVPGVEIQLRKKLSLDLSGHFNRFVVDDYDLSPIGLPPAGSGTTFEARIGVTWRPDDGWPAGPAVEGAPAKKRDGWGVAKNGGFAAAEALAINWVASGTNEYTRNQNFTQVSPRSWWDNFEEGFTFDDNQFKTNQYIHPWNGAAYYNSARTNGFGYWGSTLFALAGAFFWECCGETHPMSYNDMISTGIGGIAVGEEMYRLSGQLLDNEDTGKSRVAREIGGFLIDPVRGFNRTIAGRASNVHDNPSEPLDWRGNHARFFVFTGARIIGQGESISNNTKTYGFIGINHTFGSVFDNERRRPFDSLAADYQFSIGEKEPRTVLRIRGDLFSRPLGGDGTPGSAKYAFAVVQHFDYNNNHAYEFGQQAFGPSFFARYRLSNKMGLGLRWDGMVSILAAVNSDYAFLADVANQERFREYDYGPGLGTGLEATLDRKQSRLIGLYYRLQWINVRNGSIFNRPTPDGSDGSNADHYLQALGARAFVPVYKKLGLGADAMVVLRKSDYGASFLEDQDQRNPEARVYVAWDLGH